MNALYIVTVYVVLDDLLKAMHHQDDPRACVTTAEILTVAVVAARYFQNHHERALAILQLTHAIPPLSVSRFNRRLHQAFTVLEEAGRWLGSHVAKPWLCVMDSFPLPICHRVRLERCKKVQGNAFLSWCAAKREWFYGLRLHWLCDAAGVPISFTWLPARWHELTVVHELLAELPPHTCVVADGAYLSFADRDLAWEAGRVVLVVPHRGRMVANTPDERGLLSLSRSVIETAHSQLSKMGVQRLHARTLDGFILKLLASLLALLFNHLV